MNRSRFCISAVMLAVLIGALPTAQASPEGMAAADQVSQDSYYDFLDLWLHTHQGQSRSAVSGPDHDPARDNILELFQSYGLSAELESFSGYYSGENVVATKLGTVYPDQIYIFGGHYDSVNCPGANDNASGVAGVLEAARILSQYPSDYTIRFIAFDQEEQGLIGSGAYVDAHSGDNILGMISADMIAYDPDTGACNVYGRTTSNPIKQSLADAIDEYGDGLTPIIGGDEPYSNHAPFESAGFQACLLIEGEVWSDPYYHSTQDSFEQPGNLNFPYAVRMTRSVVGWLVDQAHVHLAPLFIDLPDGVPWRVDPGTPVDLTVQIRDGGEDYVPGTGMVYYRSHEVGSPGGEYDSAPLTQLSGDLYQATIPPAECGFVIDFYLSADGDGGTTIYYPFDAPTNVFTIPSMNLTVYLDDDFETDQGWTVSNDPSLTTGEWQRAVPLTSDDRGAPATDFDGSGTCFVTANVSMEDVDGGPTNLISPSFDFRGATDPIFSYARWIYCDDQLPPSQDFLDVQLSDSGGATWVTAEHVSGLGGWAQHELHVRDFVSLTATVQLRFSVADSPNNSLTEAAVDSVYVYDLWCSLAVPCDLNCDGVVDGFDIDPFVLALVDHAAYEAAYPDCDYLRADINGDGHIDGYDIDPFVYCITEGGAIR
jgi:hypothetical protein